MGGRNSLPRHWTTSTESGRAFQGDDCSFAAPASPCHASQGPRLPLCVSTDVRAGLITLFHAIPAPAPYAQVLANGHSAAVLACALLALMLADTPAAILAPVLVLTGDASAPERWLPCRNPLALLRWCLHPSRSSVAGARQRRARSKCLHVDVEPGQGGCPPRGLSVSSCQGQSTRSWRAGRGRARAETGDDASGAASSPWHTATERTSIL